MIIIIFNINEKWKIYIYKLYWYIYNNIIILKKYKNKINIISINLNFYNLKLWLCKCSNFTKIKYKFVYFKLIINIIDKLIFT